MKGLEILLKQVSPQCHRKFANFKKEILRIDDKVFGVYSIEKIMSHLRWKDKLKNDVPLVIEINSSQLSDLSTLVVLKVILLYIIRDLEIQVKFKFTKHSIKTNTFFLTSSIYSLHDKWIYKDDIAFFYKLNTTLNMYSRICENNDKNSKGEFISVIGTDIYSLLTNHGFGVDFSSDVSELVIEAIGNVFDHTKQDCIIEVLCTGSMKNGNIPVNLVYFSCVGITDTLLGQEIEKSINKGLNNLSGFDIVKKAYQIQKSIFNDNYSLKDFSFISAFQKSVSTRKKSIESGGTGLTKIMLNIQNRIKEDSKFSYILSGNRALYFHHDFLHLNDDGTIGFNRENDYYSTIPSGKVFNNNEVYFPGTIINILVDFEREVFYESNKT